MDNVQIFIYKAVRVFTIAKLETLRETRDFNKEYYMWP